MAYAQPSFHGLTVKATWNGEVNQAVGLDITFDIDAIPNSRLRLISLQAATHADMTGVNESSPPATYTGEVSTFLTQSVKEIEPNRDRKTTDTTTDLGRDAPLHSNHASRIPLPMSKNGSLSPQKRPLPTAQRPPWRSPGFHDITKSRARSSRADESKSMTSYSADGSCSPTKPASENLRGSDPTRRGRELLRAEVSRRASHRPLSGPRTAQSTPEQKVTEWLDQNEHAPVAASVKVRKYSSEDHSKKQHIGASSIIDADDEHENLPPNPTQFSQAIVRWTSVRYRNPLQLRGAGPCAASLEKINGCLYAVFPSDVMQVVHRVQIQARVLLRKDSTNGGYLLELPGLPTQDKTEGCFTLFIIGDDDGDFPTYRKIAHVDKDFGTNVMTGPRIDLGFDADASFSIKFLRFKEGLQVLKDTDFEIDYDVQTFWEMRTPGSVTRQMIGCKHLVVCSLRLRDFLIWADHLQIPVFISGGHSLVHRSESVTGDYQMYFCDQNDDCYEREVIITINAADFAKPFGLVFEEMFEAPAGQYWVPRVSRSRQLAQDIRVQRENNICVKNVGFDEFPEKEVQISKVGLREFLGDFPTCREIKDEGLGNIRPRRAFKRCCNIWYAMQTLFVVSMVGYFVATQLVVDNPSVDRPKEMLRDIAKKWTDWTAKMSELPLAAQTEIEEEAHPRTAEDLQRHGEKAGACQSAMQELSFRDKVDRALGWKGPIGHF